MYSSDAYVKTDIDEQGIATLSFFHPKSNSLPSDILEKMTNEIVALGQNEKAKVIILHGDRNKPFCAGASFDELISIRNFEAGKKFFMGFANLILAMKSCPKFIIARVHGKIVGGGVGLAAAADYSIATVDSLAKLSELALAIGPFVIGPVVERKIGVSAFMEMTIDSQWRDAEWCLDKGLYSQVTQDIDELDLVLAGLASKLADYSPEAMAELKRIFYSGTDDWPEKLEHRAETSGRLVLSDFTRNKIAEFKNA